MIDPAKHFNDQLEEIRAELPEATATLERTREKKKAVVALAMQRAGTQGFNSAAAQEREAYASKEYSDYLGELFDAVVKCESLRMKYKGLQTRTDIWRTQQSTRRAEMNLT